MELRVLAVLCALACLALPLSAQIVPGEATGAGNSTSITGDLPVKVIFSDEAAQTGDSIEYIMNTPVVYGNVLVTVAAAANTASICFEQSGEQSIAIATNSLPRMVVLERTGNVYFVRNVKEEYEGTMTITVSDNGSDAGKDSNRHTLAPGEKRFFAVPVADRTSHHWVDIGWDASAGDLVLNIYPPDGRLGPYTDADDGRSPGPAAKDRWSSRLRRYIRRW
jgi:hypothetical protein